MFSVGQLCNLSDLKVSQEARVCFVENENLQLRRRLFDMGITKGVIVKIKKIAPLGDPVGIEIRGYELCVRRIDLKQIKVEVLK